MKKKPEYQVAYSENEGIIEIVLNGEVTVNSVNELQNEVLAIIKERNAALLLIDIRTLIGRLGVTDAFYRVRSYPPDSPRMPTAIVDISRNADFQSFNETTAINSGLCWKCFTALDAARAWLRSTQIESVESACSVESDEKLN